MLFAILSAVEELEELDEQHAVDDELGSNTVVVHLEEDEEEAGFDDRHGGCTTTA